MGETLGAEDIRYLDAQAVAEQRRADQTNVHLGGMSFGEAMAELEKKRKNSIQNQFASKYLESDEK